MVIVQLYSHALNQIIKPFACRPFGSVDLFLSPFQGGLPIKLATYYNEADWAEPYEKEIFVRSVVWATRVFRFGNHWLVALWRVLGFSLDLCFR